MQSKLPDFQLEIPSKLYLKDPQSSDLGRRILENSIELIQHKGLKWFTFQKLAKHINTHESSIYRYFENKNKLLVYLISWYWGWLEFKLIFWTKNIEDKHQLLRCAITAITEEPKQDENFGFINEKKLHHIIVKEYSKAFYISEKNPKNNGDFLIYKQLNDRLANIIRKANPAYCYPKMLSNTILQGALTQNFFEEYFPQLSDDIQKDKTVTSEFFTDMIFKTLF